MFYYLEGAAKPRFRNVGRAIDDQPHRQKEEPKRGKDRKSTHSPNLVYRHAAAISTGKRENTPARYRERLAPETSFRTSHATPTPAHDQAISTQENTRPAMPNCAISTPAASTATPSSKR